MAATGLPSPAPAAAPLPRAALSSWTPGQPPQARARAGHALPQHRRATAQGEGAHGAPGGLRSRQLALSPYLQLYIVMYISNICKYTTFYFKKI